MPEGTVGVVSWELHRVRDELIPVTSTVPPDEAEQVVVWWTPDDNRWELIDYLVVEAYPPAAPQL